MSQLIVKNLSLGYDGIVVSEGINFQVNKGDYLCIVGENGSGKSTLMKTLLGLQKPLSGEIILSDGLSRVCAGNRPVGIFGLPGCQTVLLTRAETDRA